MHNQRHNSAQLVIGHTLMMDTHKSQHVSDRHSCVFFLLFSSCHVQHVSLLWTFHRYESVQRVIFIPTQHIACDLVPEPGVEYTTSVLHKHRRAHVALVSLVLISILGSYFHFSHVCISVNVLLKESTLGAELRNIKGHVLAPGSNNRQPARKHLIDSPSFSDSKSTEASTSVSMDELCAVDSASSMPSTSRVAEVRLL